MDGHHPEGRPGALALRQLDASLHVAVLPTGIPAGIDAAGIDGAVLLEAVNLERTFRALRYGTALGRRLLHVGLQLVVHPSGTRRLIRPVAFQNAVRLELVLPDKLVAIERTEVAVLDFGRGVLGDRNDGAPGTGLHDHCSLAVGGKGVLGRHDVNLPFVRCSGVIGDLQPVVVAEGAPLARSLDIDGERTAFMT